VEPINQLIEKWRSNNGPVLFSRFVNPAGSQWERLLHWTKMRSDKEIAFPDELNVGAAETRSKSSYSAWSQELTSYCQKNSIDTVVICGIDTDQCVLATAIDVFDDGLKPIVMKDCCASSAGDEFHQSGLMLLERLIGKDQILEKLNDA
jgi:nicotinamidase-related amidase